MTVTVGDALARLDEAVATGELAALCRRFDVEIVTLFGSAVQEGVVHEPGDLDLAVGFARGARGDLLGVLDALAGLVPGDHLDVMDLNRAGPVAQRAAMFGSRVLYATSGTVVAEREIRAFMEYEDTRWLRDLQTKVLQQ